VDHLITILVAFPVGNWGSHLPGGIRQRSLAEQPVPDQYQQSGRRAVDHLRYAWPGHLCAHPASHHQRSGFGLVDPTTSNGRTILSASLTLTLLVLPLIIINAQEAIRAVPRSLREASYGLGGTKWQTVWYHVLPNAIPGILTGTILAISRAIGETAPLVVIGAATYITFDPDGPFRNLPPCRSRFTSGLPGRRLNTGISLRQPSSCCWVCCCH
jgi:phosphate transport system permease protein